MVAAIDYNETEDQEVLQRPWQGIHFTGHSAHY